MKRLWKQIVSGLSPRTLKINRPTQRRVVLECEAMEDRLLMTIGLLAPLQQPLAAGNFTAVTNGIVGPLATAVLAPPLTKQQSDAQMGLPMLDSKPDAPATLYLDFSGNFESDWWQNNSNGTQTHFHNVTTPVFDTDGDPTKFSADEQNTIKQIWARVAEDYAPFNINVSTDYYGSLNDRQALKVAIGGNNTDWLHQNASGISSIGSFTDSAPNVVFVFDLIAWAKAGVTDGLGRPIDGIAAMATSISHEAGHSFGLYHQSLYNVSGDKLQEYNPGSGGWAPIMGDNLSAAARTTWDADENDQRHYQDDMAVIASANNGFGFRADDHGNTIATADPLTRSLYAFGPLTGKGIIEQMNDVDAFSFTTGGGALQVTVNAAQFGPNLIPVAQLWSSSGFVADADAGSFTQSIIHANVGAGTYYVLVKGFGDYGDVGQYTVSVNFSPVLTTAAATTTTTAPVSQVSGGSVLLSSAVLGQNPTAGAGGFVTQVTPLTKTALLAESHIAALTTHGEPASTGRLSLPRVAPRHDSPLDLFFADYALPVGIG
jgi:hypothetical protein